MKKLTAILTVAAIFVSAFVPVAYALPAKVEPINPYGVTLWVPRGLVDRYNLRINDSLAIDDDKNFVSRRIYTTDAISDENDTVTLSSGTDGSIGLIRFKMAKDWSGSRRWKQSFTWEFDFRLNTLGKYIMFRFGNASIKFTKDSQTDQYYINWENGTDPAVGISHPLSVIWQHKEGELLQFGKTYHLRIEADMAEGGGIFTVFSDPETDYVQTSYKEHGVTYTKDDYVNTKASYTVAVLTSGKVDMVTDNEKMLYDKFFITAHDVETSEDGGKVSATATALSTVNYPLYGMPYLFLGIYDENGALLKSSSNSEGETVKQSTGEDGFTIDSKCSYKTELDVSDLPDGEYTVRSFMWRDSENMVVCKEPVEKSITVSGGVVSAVK